MSTIIDESAFVQAEPDKPSLIFTDEKQQGRFELGVSMLIHNWDSLDIAVVNQWGGPDSSDKRDWITGIVISLFKENNVVDVGLIEETLLYAMVDEFETNVEDDSALLVAHNIIKLYEECFNMNYNTVEILYTNWIEKQKSGIKRAPVKIEGNDSSDDGYSEDEDQNMEVHEHEHNHSHINHYAEEHETEPIVDDDGFELVQKKGKKRY